MSGMTYRGIKKDYIQVLRGRRRPPWAAVQRNIIAVPGMPGGYLSSTDTSMRIVDVPILIKAENIPDLQKVKEDLAEWLITDNPEELIFDDESDRIYYAVVDGSLDIEEIVDVGRGVINFICPDPYKYGAEKMVLLNSAENTITNAGTAETFPSLKAEVLQPITHLAYLSEDAYMQIGQPVSVSDQPFEQRTVILNDELSSTIGWTDGTQVDGGIVAGTFASDGEALVPSSYGTGSAWHGPAAKKSLSEQLTDYRIEMYLDFRPVGGTTGRTELYTLDSTGNIIGKLALVDSWKNSTITVGEVRLGEITTGELINHGPWEKDRLAWNDFHGVIMLQKIGNVFECYITEADPETWRHYNSRYTRFTDYEGKFTDQLAAVQLHFGAYGTDPVLDTKISRVQVYKINNPADNQVPYIAKAGDSIEIDHKTDEIRINGEIRTDLKDFGATYFPLKKGDNKISVIPGDSVSAELIYRERFK